jgi:hypothetical protein
MRLANPQSDFVCGTVAISTDEVWIHNGESADASQTFRQFKARGDHADDISVKAGAQGISPSLFDLSLL